MGREQLFHLFNQLRNDNNYRITIECTTSSTNCITPTTLLQVILYVSYISFFIIMCVSVCRCVFISVGVLHSSNSSFHNFHYQLSVFIEVIGALVDVFLLPFLCDLRQSFLTQSPTSNLIIISRYIEL